MIEFIHSTAKNLARSNRDFGLCGRIRGRLGRVYARAVVVNDETSEFRSGPYMREESACGTLTRMKEKLLPYKRRDLDPNLF